MNARRLVASLALLMTVAADRAPPPPKRIVSLNLCADQLLVALADRGQIAALTQLSRDGSMSAIAVTARSLPVTRGDLESVIALRPDLVLATPGRDVTRMVPGGLTPPRLVGLWPADSYAAITAQVREVAAAVGHAERGERLIARMDAELRAIPKPRTGGATVANYQRRGYLTGGGTLVDEMIRRAGLVNLATRLGKPSLSYLSLEELVAARPDYLLEDADDRVIDQGTELLHHPALAGFRRLRLPDAWVTCGGPTFPAAVRSLVRQTARARPLPAASAPR